MRVVIADDQALFREGIKSVLSGRIWITSFEETDSIDGMFDLINGNQSDTVLLLDISLAMGRYTNLVQRIKSKHPELRILLIGMYPEDSIAVQMLKSGALGYLSKTAPVKEFLVAVQKVVNGCRYISAATAEKLAEQLMPNPDKLLHETLSEREFDIMCLIAMGKAPGQIAQELNLSTSTISTHRNRILKKMNMQTNAQLISYAIKHKLVS